MEIQFNNNLVMINGDELKHEDISPNFMMEFIEKVISAHNSDDFEIIGEAVNPLQMLVKNVALGSTDDTFIETIKKLEEDTKSSQKIVEETGEINYDIIVDEEK